MKLQNLAIIFLVIAIPLILILSYYINLQRTTLQLQTSYNDKLMKSAETAIQSFEINTVEWNEKYSEEEDSKRRDIEASINSFITNLANNMGVAGTSKEYILNYVPAIIYTLSDGYYAYYKTNNPQTLKDANGVQLYWHDTPNANGQIITTDAVDGHILYVPQTGRGMTDDGYNYTMSITDAMYANEYILKPIVKYSAEYKQGTTDIIVNYTMNNYIKIFGQYNSDIIETSGFLVYFDSTAQIPKILNITTGNQFTVSKKISEMQYQGNEIKPEILTEQVYIRNEGVKEYKYIYNIQDQKIYYDEITDEFFTVDNNTRTNTNELVDAQYRSISLIEPGTNNERYIKIYQSLSGSQKGTWYIDNVDRSGVAKRLGDLEVRRWNS